MHWQTKERESEKGKREKSWAASKIKEFYKTKSFSEPPFPVKYRNTEEKSMISGYTDDILPWSITPKCHKQNCLEIIKSEYSSPYYAIF